MYENCSRHLFSGLSDRSRGVLTERKRWGNVTLVTYGDMFKSNGSDLLKLTGKP